MITFVLEMYVLGAAKKAAPNWKHVPLKKYVDFLVLVLSYLMGIYFFNLSLVLVQIANWLYSH